MKCCECDGEIIDRDKRNKFCSRSCSARYNNKLRLKRPNTGTEKCECGGKKTYQGKVCKKCFDLNRALAWLIKPLSSLMNRGNGQYKYNDVRKHAKRMMFQYKVDKKCVLCGFNIVVHVDHIKDIATFSPNTLISEVNGLQNLRYLCPNHHAMKDKGLL